MNNKKRLSRKVGDKIKYATNCGCYEKVIKSFNNGHGWISEEIFCQKHKTERDRERKLRKIKDEEFNLFPSPKDKDIYNIIQSSGIIEDGVDREEVKKVAIEIYNLISRREEIYEVERLIKSYMCPSCKKKQDSAIKWETTSVGTKYDLILKTWERIDEVSGEDHESWACPSCGEDLPSELCRRIEVSAFDN
jgi:uncharacterized protein (UPF0212 family)